MAETPLFGTVSQSDFESQYRRILEVTECKTQVELADFFEIKQSSISDAKRRHAIPSGWLIKLFEKKRISPAWVRTGVGGKMVQTSDAAGGLAPAFTAAIERRPAEECTTEELLAEIARRVRNWEPDTAGR